MSVRFSYVAMYAQYTSALMLFFVAVSSQASHAFRPIPRLPTVCRVTLIVVRLVTRDCTGGLSKRYSTVDSMADVDRTSAGVE